MTLAAIHLAPNAPWLALAALSLVLVALGLWAYRFSLPPLAPLARGVLTTLRIAALVALAWLLAQPILERVRASGGAQMVVMVDRSRSMELPSGAGAGDTRERAAERAVAEITRALRGRATVREVPFAGRLGTDSSWVAERAATATGSALAALPNSPLGPRTDGVIVISDGVVNAGVDPPTAAGALGVPVHGVLVGRAGADDRAIGDVESSVSARVGEATPVRVRVTSTEPRGTPLLVRLRDGERELARATIVAPGSGAEAVAEMRATPVRPGLAVWTATLDSLAGEVTARNNQRQVAVDVAPGKLEVLIVSGGLNWDLAFMRRALAGDSSLSLTTWARERDGWLRLEGVRHGDAPGEGDLRGKAVVVLDGVSPAELGAGFDRGLVAFMRGGGGVLALGGEDPGLLRFAGGSAGAELGTQRDALPVTVSGHPAPTPEGRELLEWDDDPARGERAWRGAAPLAGAQPVRAGAGDRVLIETMGGGPPLLLARRAGRGQALLLNGTGIWRWTLSGVDELSAERGKRLWRRLIRWLAEPVQGEPLRVRPERWVASRGEGVRLFASLQSDDFRPLTGAEVEGQLRTASGATQRVRFTARDAGSYVATLGDLEPGRYTMSAVARRGGRELGRANTEFAVDRWSLEEARAEPDSAGLAALVAAAGGQLTTAEHVGAWVRGIPLRALARPRTESLRLWESPWVFALIVGALSVEWAWRRRRGLP